MSKIIFACLIFLSLTSFKLGEPDAILDCKSASGRTLFHAELPNCSYLGNADFSIDGIKYSFTSGDICGVVFDPDIKILTIYLETNNKDSKQHRFLKFWALPDSFKKIKSATGPGSKFDDVYEFKAKIYGTEPRLGFENNTKTIELNCTLEFVL